MGTIYTVVSIFHFKSNMNMEIKLEYPKTSNIKTEINRFLANKDYDNVRHQIIWDSGHLTKKQFEEWGKV